MIGNHFCQIEFLQRTPEIITTIPI